METLPTVTNALTIDFEDWYHGLELPADRWEGLEDRIGVATDRLLGILEKARCRATFFVLGWLADRHPELVRRLRDAGHELGTHGYSHRMVYTMEPEEFRRDLRRSIDLISGITGKAVTTYRAPYFSITQKSLWALEILAECGIRVDSSIFPVRNYRYGIPGAPLDAHARATPSGEILEVPISVIEFMGQNVPVSGGAYFRILPYWVTRRGIAAINARGRPAVFYLHPWEVDPGHPRIPLPRRIALTHYHNLPSAGPRLERLLGEVKFSSIEEVFGVR